MRARYPFKLRFSKKAIPKWLERYPPEDDLRVVNVLPSLVKARGFYIKEELQEYCHWKSPGRSHELPRIPLNMWRR